MHEVTTAAVHSDVAGNGGKKHERAISIEGVELMRDSGVAENRRWFRLRIILRDLANLRGRNVRHALRPFRCVAFVGEMFFQLLEAENPFRDERFVMQPLCHDVPKHAEHERHVGVRFRRDPFIGLRAGWGQARIDHDKFRFRLRAFAQEVSERNRMRLGLVGAEEKKIFRRPEVFLPGALVLAVTIREISEAEGGRERVAAGVIANRTDISVVRRAEQGEETPDDRTGAALQTAAGFIRDRVRFAGIAQRDEFLRDCLERFVPRARLELRFRRTLFAAHPFQRSR